MRPIVFASLAAIGHLSGCTQSQPYNVMMAPATCDSVPLPLARDERAGGELPSGISASADSGAVIGVVLEARTGRPLQSASVWLRPVGSSVASTTDGHAVTNAAGGFTLRPVRPGVYTMRASLIGYSPRQRTITVRPGAIDTVGTELTYMHCVGY
jgi:hypothetical protein